MAGKDLLFHVPVPYIPPDFAMRIKDFAPLHRINLSMKPTPVHPWNLTGISSSTTLSIKRDDMTGSTASGNKVRKLEFLLAHALKQGCNTIITAGGIQSNHARATAVLARELGLSCHVFLRDSRSASMREKEPVPEPVGNLLLHRLVGSHVHFVPSEPFATGLLPRMKHLRDELLSKHNEKAYLICIGGSDHIGVWGYIDAYAELLSQGIVADKYTDIVVAVGSGGTACGLAVGNYLSGSAIKVTAIGVCDNAEYFYDHVDGILKGMHLDKEVKAKDILKVIMAKGRGYARSTERELQFCKDVANETGVVLDRVYSAKAALKMMDLLKNDGVDEESGERVFEEHAKILFVHTGGIFGVFDGEIAESIQKDSMHAQAG